MKKFIMIPFLVLILAFALVGCSGGGGGGSDVNKYAGTWTGDWKVVNGSDSSSGTASITVSNSGGMSGSLTDTTDPSATKTTTSFSGQVTGNTTTFSYKYPVGTQIDCSGSFGEISNNSVTLSFSYVVSGKTWNGTCNLTKQ